MSIDGVDKQETEINGVKVEHQQLNVGHAYAVPSLFAGWRLANNEGHPLSNAAEDIATGGEKHAEVHSDKHPNSPGFLFTLKNKIKELEAKLAGK